MCPESQTFFGWYVSQAVDELGEDRGADMSTVLELIKAYTPDGLCSTLQVERTFNDLRTAERRMKNASASSTAQLHAVTAKSIFRQCGEGADIFQACIRRREGMWIICGISAFMLGCTRVGCSSVGS